MDRRVWVGSEVQGAGADGLMRLGDIAARLKSAYGGNTTLQYMHIPDVEKRSWLRSRMESEGLEQLTPTERKRVYCTLRPSVHARDGH